MSKWFYFNLMVLALALWNVIGGSRFPIIHLHILFGLAGLLFVLFNWTRHAVFSTIRHSPDREKKIKLATISKKVLVFHRWTGTLALVFIIIHVALVINRYGFFWENLKMVSGLVTGIFLISMVVTGWMRLIRPSGRKRRAHLRLGMVLFFLIMLHLIF
ncbi:hypothetical protein [Virgibacillus ainsalahensis]